MISVCVFRASAVLTAAWLPRRWPRRRQEPRSAARLANSLSGDPVGDLTVTIDELRRETQAASDGTFRFDNVPPGTITCRFAATGSARGGPRCVWPRAPSPSTSRWTRRFTTPKCCRSALSRAASFESYQPTTVLAGQELTKQLESSLGATLENQPGLAARSFGPAPARPVIRGLDGDRVLILQDSQRMGDLSSQSADHGVTVNPAASQRIEVVRGPATLLYGANAIGGLVNVITEQIPTAARDRRHGQRDVRRSPRRPRKAAAPARCSASATAAFALHARRRRAADGRRRRHPRATSTTRSRAAASAPSACRGRAPAATSAAATDTTTRSTASPVVEDGSIQLTPRRHAFTPARRSAEHGRALRLVPGVARASGATGTTSSRATRSARAFTNNTADVERARARIGRIGRLKGSVGGAVLDRAFDSQGEEALSPAVDQSGFARVSLRGADLAACHVSVRRARRARPTSRRPASRQRDFTNVSGSVGLLFRPAGRQRRVDRRGQPRARGAQPGARGAVLLRSAHRELRVRGRQPGRSSPSRRLGSTLSLRWRIGRGRRASSRTSGTPSTTSSSGSEIDARGIRGARSTSLPHGSRSREIDAGDGRPSFPIVEFVGADSRASGDRGARRLCRSPQRDAELGVDYVRGIARVDRRTAAADSAVQVPRRAAVSAQRAAGGRRHRGGAAQERIYGVETPTDGYTTLKLFGSYSFDKGGVLSTITARLDNATNELYRNHLSYIKDFVPEMGRSFRLLYNVKF